MLSKTESLLLWSSNLWGLGLGMFGPLYAVFAREVGGDVLELTWVYAAYLFVMGIGVIYVGKFGDKVGHERLLVFGRVLGTIATFGYLFVGSIASLFIVQIILGIAFAFSEPSWYALYDKHSGDGGNDGYVWGLSAGLWYMAQGTGLVIGGYIVTWYSFDALFVTMGTIVAISTFYQMRILQSISE